MRMLKKLLAECIGTYFLVFAGTGAIIVDHLTHTLSHSGVAITFGLAVLALIYTFGHISGAHFNPAVTIGFAILKDISAAGALMYITAQTAGAVLASVSLLAIFGNVAHLGATVPNASWQQSFMLEAILTFGLMMVILGSSKHGKAVKSFAGMAIGSTVGLEAMFAGPICGASMNPARSLAPAIVSGTADHLWVYLVSTVLGALAAACVYKFIHESSGVPVNI